MCVCVYVCMCLCVYVSMCLCVYVSMCVCLCICKLGVILFRVTSVMREALLKLNPAAQNSPSTGPCGVPLSSRPATRSMPSSPNLVATIMVGGAFSGNRPASTPLSYPGGYDDRTGRCEGHADNSEISVSSQPREKRMCESI
jgi:hypothetical protein